MSYHPLNNMGWSEVRERLCEVLRLAAKYLELRIEEMESKQASTEKQKDS